MAGQVMEAHHQAARLQPPTMAPPFAPLPHNTCKPDVHHHHLNTMTTTMATATSGSITNNNDNTGTTGASSADMAAYLQQLQDAAEAAAKSNGGGNGGAARGEQCPRCASHDTKFCYYNNYNTSQPRHFCRACRRYWTLGGSLRNVPIGGSTRKRPRLAAHHHQHARRAPAAHAFAGLGLGGAGAAPPMMPPLPSSSPSSAQGQGQQGGGLLGSLFALGAAGPLLEGRGAGSSSSSSFDFDLGLGLPTGPLHLGAGAVEAAGLQMRGLGLGIRGGGSAAAAGSSSFLWPAGLLVDNHSVDTWKMPPGAGAGSMWPDFSSPAAAPQTGGLLHGGAHLM